MSCRRPIASAVLFYKFVYQPNSKPAIFTKHGFDHVCSVGYIAARNLSYLYDVAFLVITKLNVVLKHLDTEYDFSHHFVIP